MRWLPFLLCPFALLAQKDAHEKLSLDIFRELIEIDTTPKGGTGKAVESLAAHFRAAGFWGSDVQVVGPRQERSNLVVRLHGAGASRPVLFIGHLDVVEAKREDWSVDPFHLTEQDGFYYGRGAVDMKSDVANMVSAFLRMKAEGFQPGRDLILALTANEEAGGADNGMSWLLQNRRDLIDAEYAINPDSGGGEARGGKPSTMGLQFSEKTYLSFRLECKDRGGHSSLPRKDNPIYHIADALGRLERFDFPVMLSKGTSSYLERLSHGETSVRAGAMRKLLSSNPPDTAAGALLSKDPQMNALLRTTCVATELSGGHAENALPQTAAATVNCRILPWHSPAEVQSTLIRVVNDPKIQITALQSVEDAGSPPSPLRQDVCDLVRGITASKWPGVPVTPVMSNGASDGKYLRRAGIPTYGVSGIFTDSQDSRAHGRDERVGIREFFEGGDFLYQLMEKIGR